MISQGRINEIIRVATLIRARLPGCAHSAGYHHIPGFLREPHVAEYSAIAKIGLDSPSAFDRALSEPFIQPVSHPALSHPDSL